MLRIRNALISVSNKTGLETLGKFLFDKGVTVFSTGGTYRTLESLNSDKLRKVSDLTKFPELFNGRVKTLHPTIYGGILARRGYPSDVATMETYDIPPIDLVVANLYPFKETVEGDASENEVIENIDIGGPSMVRAAAKNFADVTVLTSPDQYPKFMRRFDMNTTDYRKELAKVAFQHVTDYDIDIANWFSADGDIVYRSYKKISPFKYGLNPNQKAGIYVNKDDQYPFEVVNGRVGYINMLDAVHAWNLVKEFDEYLNDERVCAASYKHTSPAGVAFSRPLNEREMKLYGVPQELSPAAQAYILARNCDPKSSFGDFVAISSTVNEETARLIKREVCDGIVAKDFTPEAVAILKTKKKGKFPILKVTNETNQDMEIREYHGVTFIQEKNKVRGDDGFPEVDFNKQIRDNLVLANTTLKYTQSNSVAFSWNNQCVVAAGQQNRVDCTMLAGEKMKNLIMRYHPKVQLLLDKFKDKTRRQDKVNAIYQYLSDEEMTSETRETWLSLFREIPDNLTMEEIEEYLVSVYQNREICLASDAFFPFEDNIDVAYKYGVAHIVQTGGSIRDAQVKKRADEYGMRMIMTGNRLFLH